MSNKTFTAILFGCFLFILAFFFYFAAQLLIPVRPKASYFPAGFIRIPQLHWYIDTFQPIYLYSSQKNGNRFLKVAYRNHKNQVKFLDVFISGKLPNQSANFDLPFVNTSNNENENSPSFYPKKFNELKPYLKFGKQVGILYVKSVKDRFSEGVVLPWAKNAKSDCKNLGRLCDVAIYVGRTNDDEFYQFEDTGNFNKVGFFPCIGITPDLIQNK